MHPFYEGKTWTEGGELNSRRKCISLSSYLSFPSSPSSSWTRTDESSWKTCRRRECFWRKNEAFWIFLGEFSEMVFVTWSSSWTCLTCRSCRRWRCSGRILWRTESPGGNIFCLSCALTFFSAIKINWRNIFVFMCYLHENDFGPEDVEWLVQRVLPHGGLWKEMK